MQVLIIDDSIVCRRLISDALSVAPDIEISYAANGDKGLAKIARQRPDLVTLDIEMPGSSGFEVLKVIRQKYPLLPVIMLSRLTEQGASATIDALFFGANDYVAKPPVGKGIEQSIDYVRKQLLPKIRGLCQAKKSQKKTSIKTQETGFCQQEPQAIKIIVIGSSTGGPNALTELLSGLENYLTVPVVIAQHTLPEFSKHIARRLSENTHLDIKEGCDGEILNPQDIWLAPGDQHMLVTEQGGLVKIENCTASRDEPAPSVDKLFSSVARTYGSGVLAIVLTGMGNDGLMGCQDIKKKGGHIIVQDEASSVVWGMPGSVAEAGLADEIMPVGQMVSSIIKRLGG